MAKASKSAEVAEMTVAEKLKALYDLQMVDTAVDKIRILRGELPLEVQDLEDEIEGLQTRVSKYDDDIEGLEKSINGKKQEIVNAQELIKKGFINDPLNHFSNFCSIWISQASSCCLTSISQHNQGRLFGLRLGSWISKISFIYRFFFFLFLGPIIEKSNQ